MGPFFHAEDETVNPSDSQAKPAPCISSGCHICGAAGLQLWAVTYAPSALRKKSPLLCIKKDL